MRGNGVQMFGAIDWLWGRADKEEERKIEVASD